MNEKKKYSSVCVTSDTLDKLTYISEVSAIPKIKLLQLCIDELFEVGSSFSQLAIEVDSSILKSQVIFTLGGKSRLISGSEKNLPENLEIESEFLAKEMQKNAEDE